MNLMIKTMDFFKNSKEKKTKHLRINKKKPLKDKNPLHFISLRAPLNQYVIIYQFKQIKKK